MIVNEQYISSVGVIFGAKPVFQKQLVMFEFGLKRRKMYLFGQVENLICGSI